MFSGTIIFYVVNRCGYKHVLKFWQLFADIIARFWQKRASEQKLVFIFSCYK